MRVVRHVRACVCARNMSSELTVSRVLPAAASGTSDKFDVECRRALTLSFKRASNPFFTTTGLLLPLPLPRSVVTSADDIPDVGIE